MKRKSWKQELEDIRPEKKVLHVMVGRDHVVKRLCKCVWLWSWSRWRLIDDRNVWPSRIWLNKNVVYFKFPNYHHLLHLNLDRSFSFFGSVEKDKELETDQCSKNTAPASSIKTWPDNQWIESYRNLRACGLGLLNLSQNWFELLFSDFTNNLARLSHLNWIEMCCLVSIVKLFLWLWLL